MIMLLYIYWICQNIVLCKALKYVICACQLVLAVIVHANDRPVSQQTL